MNLHKILSYTAFATALWSPNAYCQLQLGDAIGVDFGVIAPAAGTNFNQFDANANSISNGDTLAFSAQTGAPAEMINIAGNSVPGVGFTVENQTGQSTNRATLTNAGTGPAPFDDSTIFSDLMISNNQGSNMLNTGGFFVLTFTGLDDSLDYDLVGGMNRLGNNAENFDTDWTAGGTTMLADSVTTTPYVTFEGLTTDGNGNLTITLTRNTGHVNVAALTLTAVTPTAAIDSDGDGIADNFEENFFPGDLTQLNGLASGPGPGAGTGDFDGDGLTDLEEFNLIARFPTLDPTDDDSDNDGLLDGVEDGEGVFVSETQTGTSPVNRDSDNDGLSDFVENPLREFEDANDTGTDPNNPDSDGDTFEDGFEVLNDGDPTDSNSLPDLSAGYDAFGSNWLSAADFGTVDINGDGLGSDGFLFFGDFTGVANDALTFADRRESLPTYVSAVTQGGGVDRVTSGFANYGSIDNPVTLDGTDQIAGFAITDGGGIFANLDILTFEVSGLAVNQVVRVGILGGIHGEESGLFDPDLIQLSSPDGINQNRGGLGPNPGFVNAGWVFFDVTQEGTYTVRSSARSQTASSGIGGLTFDSAIDLSGVVLPALCIETDPDDPNSLMFTWDSSARFLYNIISDTDLSIPTSSWAVYDDGSTVYGGIAASGTGSNTLTGVARVGETRFFALQEVAVPSTVIFTTDFEAGDDGGFFTNDPAISWEYGTPTATGPGGNINTANSGTSAWGTDLDAAYPASTTMTLSSPVIDLTGFSIATLSFAENLDLENGVTGEVWAVDSDTGADLGTEPIYSVNDADIATTAWMPVSPQDLPSEALGNVIRLEFRVTSGTDATFLGWYIDDVTVEGF